MSVQQLPLFNYTPPIIQAKRHVRPLAGQLLKWVGNKQRFALEIIYHFPPAFGTYFEPFLGSGAVLATLAPMKAIGSDCFEPLIRLFQTLRTSPETLKHWYAERWRMLLEEDKKTVYERIKASYNKGANPADLLFLSRACYGGVIRFRQDNGHMSTPVGVHAPIPPAAFSKRVDEWHIRTEGATFLHIEYEEAMDMAKPGDLVYCDPPYSFSQAILYGAQSFSFERLLSVIARCKRRGVFVVLSIDGTKRLGDMICALPIPQGLFERDVFVKVGRSMLKRFQMNGKTLEGEVVRDRLLLTF